MNVNEFIQKAKLIHDNKYDYSKVEYKNNYTKVCIICPIHDEFWQVPHSHLRGCGCRKCSVQKQTKTRELFIEQAKKVHGDKYDYSKVEYTNTMTKVCIICKEHGEFWQLPQDHLKGRGCLKCTFKLQTLEDFIILSKQIHGNKYDYSKVEYVNTSTKVCIVCPTHGEFWQTPNNHIAQKHGCPKCSGCQKMTTEEFIEKARKIHGEKYDYSKTKYINANTKVCIICPKHGEFWQKPKDHLNNKQGCPLCNFSHLEVTIENFLKENDLIFVHQKRFEWLGKQSLDFYLPQYNVAIECQGMQHFKAVKHFGGEATFKRQIERDERKKMLCEENGIKIVYCIYKQEKKNLEKLKKLLKSKKYGK